MATRDQVEGLDARVAAHYRELKELRGRVNAMKRWEKTAEDDPHEPIEPTTDIPAAPVSSTAHLARRFKVT